MALTRKFLKALNVEDAAIDEIINAHTETVEAVKSERDSYKEQAAKLEPLQKDLDALKEKVKSEYVPKTDLEKVKKEYNDYKTDVSAKQTRAATEKAVKAYLNSKGITDNIDIAMMSLESRMGDFELEGENLKDTKSLDELIGGKLSKLVTNIEKQGLDVGTPPHGSGNSYRNDEIAARAAQYHANQYGADPAAQTKGA